MTPSLLLWNGKSEHSVFSFKNGDAGPLLFTLKFEPIVNLSTARRYGCEVLTHLPANINSEHYFQQLSVQHQQDLFYQQVARIQRYRQNQYYSLNLPMKAFMEWSLFHGLIASHPSGLIIEIQDPNTFFSLDARQQATVFEIIQRLEAHEIPVWLDDVNEAQLRAFLKANWQMSCIKLDKNTFWALGQIPQKLTQVIQLGHSVARLVIVEGIETQTHKEIAFRAGADLGQGYLWPAIYPDPA